MTICIVNFSAFLVLSFALAGGFGEDFMVVWAVGLAFVGRGG